MNIRLRVLGAYAATPRRLANPSSQYLHLDHHRFLIDCGEGTQKSLRECGVNLLGIQAVFISHLHGDHFYGLPGFIATQNSLKRTDPLTVFGPKGIKELVTLILKSSDSWTRFPLHFYEFEGETSQVVFDNERLRVRTIPLVHRIYTRGFLFESNVDNSWHKIYAYCSDTQFLPGLADLLQGVFILYHEATFLESEAFLCERTKHSTAKQAGEIAALAGVNSLILGHYSTRYKNLEDFITEASMSFKKESIFLADDHKLFEFTWPQKI